MEKEIYTIGYVSFTPDEMVNVLKKYGIKCLIDVRSSPYSAYHKEYDKDVIEKKLESNGIYYRNFAYEFGARQEDPHFYTTEGYLDFELFTQSKQFQEGVSKIEKGVEYGYSFVLMCAEKDPMTCHRAIMIGRALSKNGYCVKHILDTDRIETQSEMEQRAIGTQLSFFSDEERIQEFYRTQNKKIGYQLGNEKEGIA